MISIILPAYNEEGHMKHNTTRLIKEMGKIREDYEIIIVEESSDRTPEIADELTRKYKKVRHFHSEKRLGKGRAIEYGTMKARGDKIIFMDVDLAVDLSAMKTMLNALKDYDIVVGSRYHPQSATRRTLFRLFAGRSYAVLSRIVLGVPVGDFQCGFKGFRKSAGKDIMKQTKIPGVFWDTEFLYWANKNGYRIRDIPIIWEEKKGRNTKVGIKTIFYMGMNLVKLFVRSWLDRM